MEEALRLIGKLLATGPLEATQFVGNDPAPLLEQLLLDRLGGWSEGPIMPFLVGLYRQTRESKNELLKILSGLAISYLGLIISMPNMFSQTGHEEALGSFVQEIAKGSLPTGLLESLIVLFASEEEVLLEILGALMAKIMAELQATDILSDFVGPLNALLGLIVFKEVATLLPKLPTWLPAGDARSVASSLLGTILSLGIDFEQNKPFKSLVPDSEGLTQSQWETVSYTARSAQTVLQSKTHAFLYALIKAGPETRSAVLGWFWRVSELNAGRLKMRVDLRTITPDRIIMNGYAVLLKFAEPFLPPSANKMGLVDTLYPFRLESPQTTRLNADQAKHEAFLQTLELKEEAPNFVTECFYLAVAFLRLGPIRLINSTMDIVRDLREIQRGLEEQAASSHPMRQMMLNTLHQRKVMLIDAKLISDLWLQDAQQLESTFMLVNFLMRLLMSLQDAHFQHYPESLVEGAVEWCLYISRIHPRWWQQRQQELGTLADFMMRYLDRPDLIRNPYLRSKFIDILLSWAEEDNLQVIFDQYPVLIGELMPKLQHFYVEAESTGASTQFYDKFNIRYQIAQILKAVWSRPLYLTRIKQESRYGHEFLPLRKDEFLHFVNFLVNDATYLLDESLSKLAEIHAKQAEQPQWQHLPAAEREEKEKALAQVERICQSYTFLGYETLHMLSILTTEIKQPFMRPEVVDRLAAMLDADLLQLVGPKCSELKVNNPDQFKFYPKQWLCEIIRIYLNLAEQAPFVAAIARDHRSFSRPLFEKAAAILQRTNALSSLDIDAFMALLDQVEQAIGAASQDATELGDIPDEFLGIV